MGQLQHSFGGSWTTEKLERLRKYLHAYMQIMKDKRFNVAYIDAFAGTGYIDVSQDKDNQTFLPEFEEEDARNFITGSAHVALEIEPPFHKYIFIERSRKRLAELEKLKGRFPELKDRIISVRADANEYLKDVCANRSWRRHRAVLFLDPYGMQVEWATIEAISRTKAIDLWILFPLGVAVNRLIRKDGKISEPIKKRLDRMFGTTDWFQEFYRLREKRGLFDDIEGVEKVANFDSIGRYFNRRLAAVFASVADNPLPLLNSSNNPLYLLCFAAANEAASPTAVKIARNILRRGPVRGSKVNN